MSRSAFIVLFTITMRYSSVIIRSFFLLSAEAVILAVRALILEMESDADFLDERSVAKKEQLWGMDKRNSF